MTCNDPKCPRHGGLKTRAKTLKATVVKALAERTAVVEWPRLRKAPKYDRFYRTSSKVSVHVPACMKVKAGDKVLIAETRKLSKTKAFVITEVLKDGA
ncbi:MAG TPA: 30S ribosomal protein S17 [archaeon]|nr:30S ribosomal protein S17 [archaeon]